MVKKSAQPETGTEELPEDLRELIERARRIDLSAASVEEEVQKSERPRERPTPRREARPRLRSRSQPQASRPTFIVQDEPAHEDPEDSFFENQMRLEEELNRMRKELLYLKRVNPLINLLHAKQAEVEKLKRSLQRMPVNHPDRGVFEGILKDHIVERDRIRAIAEKSENQFRDFSFKVAEIEARLKGRSRG